MAGYGVEILWQEQVQLVLTDGMWNSSKLKGGILDERTENHWLQMLHRGALTLTRRDWDKHSDWGGMSGLRQK